MERSNAELRALLGPVRTIAIVGFSANPGRASHEVGQFLVARGYACTGVNPGIAGRTVAGIPVVGRLADLAAPVDMVDVFRASHAIAALVDDVLALPVLPKLLWMQLGVVDHAAARRAEAVGIVVVMDRCPKIVLSGGLLSPLPFPAARREDRFEVPERAIKIRRFSL